MSNYRDDREALHNRIAHLENELREGKHEELASLEEKLAEMRAELAKKDEQIDVLRGKRPPAKRHPALFIGLAVGVATAVGALTFATKKPKVAKPYIQVPVLNPSPVLVPMDPVTAAPTLPLPPLVERTSVALWTARVTQAEGISAGSACGITATLATTDTNIRVKDLVVACGTQSIYRSSDRLNGMSQRSDDAREKVGDKGVFTMVYRDLGTRTGERTQIDLDTNAKQGVVFRDTIPKFKVTLAMQPASLPTDPLEKRLVQSGKVNEVTGAAPTKRDATCTLVAMANGKQKDCIAEVRCGSAVLWRESSAITCDYDDGKPSSLTAPDGNLALEGPMLTLTSKAYGVTIALDEPTP